MNKKFFTEITEAKESSTDDSNSISGFYTLISPKLAESRAREKEIENTPEPIPTGFYTLKSTNYGVNKTFNLEGTNTFELSNGESYTYNDFSFDKTKVKCYAPIELQQGWWCDRNQLKPHADLVQDTKKAVKAWEKEKDNPKSKLKKPCLDRHCIWQGDTEFNFMEFPLELQEIADLLSQESRDHHTTQSKFLPGIGETAPNIIFATKNFAKVFNPILSKKGYQELPILSEKDCDFFDYANLVTETKWQVNTSVTDAYLQTLPKFFLTLSAHNAEAELNLVFHGQLLKRVLSLQAGYSTDEGIEKRSKVVRCFSSITSFRQKISVDWVSLKAIVSIDGVDFHLCLRIIDTIKTQGIVSLKNFASASGHELNEKDLLSSQDKSNILKTALERPEDFIAYSLGDTSNLEVMYSFDNELRKIYGELGLKNYVPPSLTVGRTVVDLDFATLAEYLGYVGEGWSEKIREFVEKEIQPFSPATTIKNSAHSSAILAKGFGGRIGQNQPTQVVLERTFKKDLNYRKDFGIELQAHPNAKFKTRKIKGKFDSTIVVDIDISGAYAESQRVQVLPIGRPIVGGLRLDTVSANSYPSLREFLTSCKVDLKKLIPNNFKNYQDYRDNWHFWGELDYGSFIFFIEVPKLKEPCDMFPSWISPGKKVDHKMLCKLLADSIKGDEKAIEKIQQGCTKKLLNEISLSPINFDKLEWLLLQTTPALRKELLEKARVIAFVIYPKSYRLTSDLEDIKERVQDCQQQLEERRAQWKITNTLKLDFGEKFIMYSEEYRDCHYWYGETIGDLILNKILSKRKIAQWIKKKCPADLLYKLLCNTHYGVSISPLFAISNICVGNNITSRCRVLAWCMEKSLLGYPTITDGCFFLQNRVLYPTDRSVDSACINMDSPKSPLGHRNYGTQAIPHLFTFTDKNFTYFAQTKEYVMKNQRIFALCKVDQICKKSGVLNMFETLSPLDRIIGWKIEKGKKEAIKQSIKETLALEAGYHIKRCFPLLSVVWMDATTLKAEVIEEKDSNTLKPNEKIAATPIITESPRKGLAEFEIKDYYCEAANQGMANYLLSKEVITIKNGITTKEIEHTLAYRGYESSKPHVAISNCDNQLIKTDRYLKNNPAKDFMINLANNQNNIPRQQTAIKARSISIGDYKNNPKKFTEWNWKAGDQMKVCILFSEFAASQFTFKNKEQLFTWVDEVTKSKQKFGQSIEAWFINQDGSLRFKDMCLWAAEAIERGIVNPIKELASYGQRAKPKIGSPKIKISEDDRYHPEWFTFQKVKKCLTNAELMDEISDLENDGEETEEIEIGE